MILKTGIKKMLGETNLYKIKGFLQGFSKSHRQEVLSRKLFYQTFINKNDLCFDVGANVGNRIEPLLAIGARVLAVEPQEACFGYLKSKFGGKIILVTKGLCESEGIRTFHISNVSTISSFSDEWINSVKNDRFKEYSWDKSIDVEMTTLDSLIKEYGVPSFIKIDVEGYELEVIKGLSKQIKMISFEYTVPEQSDKIVECVERIGKNNPQALCNFSEKETMKWYLGHWLPITDFLKYIQTEEFIKTGFGDIYMKEN